MENIKSDNHLTYFKVDNFKCFDSLELEDIGHVNLILGDNNVGKSSVLESLLFDYHPFIMLRNLLGIFSHRTFFQNDSFENIDYFNFFINSKSPESNILYEFEFKNNIKKQIKLSLLDSNVLDDKQIQMLLKSTFVNVRQLPRKVISFKSSDKEELYTLDLSTHRFKDNSSYFPFIKSGLIYQDDLVDFYSRNIVNDLSLKQDFINSLHILSENILDITIDTTTVPEHPILLVLFKNNQKPTPLFMMGDGTIRLVRLILEIIMSKNYRLMIDEIDNGIHYSRMKPVWRVILQVAKKYNTQLFITTHDSECLKAFKEVLEENGFNEIQKEVRSYTLIRDSKDSIKAIKYNFSEFEHAVNYDLNVRGGLL